jgi:hypothetical protein
VEDIHPAFREAADDGVGASAAANAVVAGVVVVTACVEAAAP